MNQNSILILNQEQIALKLERMAWQIWELLSNETSVTLLGVEKNGVPLANALAKILRKISSLEVTVLPLKLPKKDPLAAAATLSGDLNDRPVVLVDDVANSGRTLLYALKPVLDYLPSRILIAVLIDRKHKAYPVAPDIVGHSIATTLHEHIVVETTDGNYISGAYLQHHKQD